MQTKSLGQNQVMPKIKIGMLVILGVSLPVMVVVAVLSVIGISTSLCNLIYFITLVVMVLGEFGLSGYLVFTSGRWLEQQRKCQIDKVYGNESSMELFQLIKRKHNILLATMVMIAGIVISSVLSIILAIELPLRYLGTIPSPPLFIGCRHAESLSLAVLVSLGRAFELSTVPLLFFFLQRHTFSDNMSNFVRHLASAAPTAQQDSDNDGCAINCSLFQFQNLLIFHILKIPSSNRRRQRQWSPPVNPLEWTRHCSSTAPHLPSSNQSSDIIIGSLRRSSLSLFTTLLVSCNSIRSQ